MRLTSSGALAGTLLALFPATALAGPTVKVRVEGATGTLLERTTVTLPDTPPPVAGGCPRYTAAAALDEGTHGNWDRNAFTQTILGESHTFTDSDYWAEWIDRGTGYRFGGGICTDVLNDGDELVMLVDRSPAPASVPTVFPLDLDGVPSSVQAGTPFTVTVVAYHTDGTPGTGQPQAVEGATVSGGHGSATTDRDGKASLRIADTGTVTLKATKPGLATSGGEVVNVTAAPAAPAPQPPAAPAPAPPETPAPQAPGAPAPPATLPATAGAPADTLAPRLAIRGLRSRAVIPARRAPRLLRGTVTDASALKAVRLSIVRRRAGACQFWSARRERFVGKRCNGTQPAFSVGTKARWSYQLPARLPAGRYYIRVTAVDIAGNRAGSRVAIRVR